MIKYLDGLRIYYEVIGSGKPILLLHGWANDSETMRAIAESLKQDGFAAYALDLPGFGLSDFPPRAWEVSDYVQIVRKFIIDSGFKKVDIIAHSFGGRITIKLASHDPELIDRIMLVDSAGIKPKRSVFYYFVVYFTKLIRWGGKLLPLTVQETMNEWLISHFGSRDYKNAGRLRETFSKVVNEDLREYLPNIKSRVLLVWGENDQETPVSDGKLMHALIPNSELEIIKKAGHHCFLDDFLTFSKIIRKFLFSDMENDSTTN